MPARIAKGRLQLTIHQPGIPATMAEVQMCAEIVVDLVGCDPVVLQMPDPATILASIAAMPRAKSVWVLATVDHGYEFA